MRWSWVHSELRARLDTKSDFVSNQTNLNVTRVKWSVPLMVLLGIYFLEVIGG